MIFENRKNLILAMSMAGLAGFVDAVGFRTLGGFFVSFMSGNSTRLAVNLSEEQWSLLGLIPLAIIVLFTMGVMMGTVIRHKVYKGKEASVLAFVSINLIIAAIFGAFEKDYIAVVFMVLAMGASNNVFVKEGEVSVGVTYMTGTLVKLGQRLAGYFIAGPKKPWLPYLALWLGLVLGAIVGSIGYSLLGLHCLWIAAGYSAILCFNFYIGTCLYIS